MGEEVPCSDGMWHHEEDGSQGSLQNFGAALEWCSTVHEVSVTS
jgi:hypothetical protein